MAAPDMDVIREIPGYKVILKAVLKSQIQQLVEQLASTTDEESVILTASVADGTLSHLGSDSGKGFLEDHEDIKSQFLGFCLKKHHRKKQDEKDQKEAEAKQFSMQASPSRYGAARYSQPGVQGQVHPMSILHASSVSSLGGNVRHEPYPVSRPAKRRSGKSNTSLMAASSPSAKAADNETIKQEVEESNDVSNDGQSQPISNDDDDDSNTLPGEPGSESVGEGADNSNVIAGSNPENTESSETDPNVRVKLEALNEAEMDLEITGVEPGRPMVPQDNWDPNISMAANYDPNMTVGSMGQQADSPNISVAGLPLSTFQDEDMLNVPLYNVVNNGDLTAYICNYGNCRKICPNKTMIERHLRVHTKEKPFACRFCQYKASRKDTLKLHEKKLHTVDY